MLQRILDGLKNEGITPSFSCVVLKNNKIIFMDNFCSLNSNTIFDCASLTKPLITFPLIKKYTDLNNKAAPLINGLSDNLKILDFVVHKSNLIPWLPLYHFKNKYIKTILEYGFSKNKTKEKVYSCLNYIILKEIIEICAKLTFKTVVNDFLNQFKGCTISPGNLQNVKPTEFGNQYEFNLSKQFVKKTDSNLYRLNELICGEVHDLNAFYDGGISGNSGLFSTSDGIVKLINNLLMFEDWNLPLFENENYYYHLGFTGTGIAISKDSAVSVIFLSNRICPQVKNINFSEIRHSIFSTAISNFC